MVRPQRTGPPSRRQCRSRRSRCCPPWPPPPPCSDRGDERLDVSLKTNTGGGQERRRPTAGGNWLVWPAQNFLRRDRSLVDIRPRVSLVLLCGERLRAEVQTQHAAVELVHVHQSPGDLDVLLVDLAHAADGHPADPLALRLEVRPAAVDERVNPRVARQVHAHADLVVGLDVLLLGADPHPAGADVDDAPERLADAPGAVPALDGDRLLLEVVSAVLAAVRSAEVDGHARALRLGHALVKGGHSGRSCCSCRLLMPKPVLIWRIWHPSYRRPSRLTFVNLGNFEKEGA